MSKLDELIAELCPDGVEYKTLGEVCEIKTGQSVSRQIIADNQGIYPEIMYFRPDNDYRTGVEIKTELIEKILQNYNIVAIFEDCESIVVKFREMGLTVLQPNKGI